MVANLVLPEPTGPTRRMFLPDNKVLTIWFSVSSSTSISLEIFMRASLRESSEGNGSAASSISVDSSSFNILSKMFLSIAMMEFWGFYPGWFVICCWMSVGHAIGFGSLSEFLSYC